MMTVCLEAWLKMTTEDLWRIVADARNGILATISKDGTPQLSNIYYLCDPSIQLVRFSTTTVRVKGGNLLRNPRAALHVPGSDFFNFAVVSGPVSLAVAREPHDDAVDKLFEIHAGLGAASERDAFGEAMVADHRMAVELHIERIYGQILDR
jgi:PPOX class probable F420-dependent enzyme